MGIFDFLNNKDIEKDTDLFENEPVMNAEAYDYNEEKEKFSAMSYTPIFNFSYAGIPSVILFYSVIKVISHIFYFLRIVIFIYVSHFLFCLLNSFWPQ